MKQLRPPSRPLTSLSLHQLFMPWGRAEAKDSCQLPTNTKHDYPHIISTGVNTIDTWYLVVPKRYHIPTANMWPSLGKPTIWATHWIYQYYFVMWVWSPLHHAVDGSHTQLLTIVVSEYRTSFWLQYAYVHAIISQDIVRIQDLDLNWCLQLKLCIDPFRCP